MDSLRITSKDQLTAHLRSIAKLEEKCYSSKILRGKWITHKGTMVRVTKLDFEAGMVAFAKFEGDRCIAILVCGDDGRIAELLMKELSDCNQIIVFDEDDRVLIQQYAPENIKVILDNL